MASLKQTIQPPPAPSSSSSSFQPIQPLTYKGSTLSTGEITSSSSSIQPLITPPQGLAKDLVSPDILFSDAPLVIDLNSESIKNLLPPQINTAYLKLGITKLEVKNIFNIIQEETFRTFIQLKLPKEIWENGYLNVFNEPEEWVPMYMSSGKNSGTENKNNWHPYLGTLNLRSRRNRGSIYSNLKQLFTASNGSYNHIVQPGGFTLENGQYWSWLAKCGSWNSAFRNEIDSMINQEKIKLDILSNPADVKKVKQRLENLRVLHKRIERINDDLFKNKLFNDKSIFTEPNSNYEKGYLCNNFFMLINETLRLLIKTDEFKFNLNAANISLPISSVREDTNYFINRVIDEENIFGLPLFEEGVAKDAIYIKKIIEYNFNKIMARAARRNVSAKTEKWLDTLILFLKDAENIKPIGNLLNEIIDDESFTRSITPAEKDIGQNKKKRKGMNLHLPKTSKTSKIEGIFNKYNDNKDGGRKKQKRKTKRRRRKKTIRKRKKKRKTKRRRRKTIRKRKKSRKKRRHPH